jgi:carbon monoxide dehydrogenase subunit G
MIVDQKTVVPAPVEKVWEFINDIPAVSTCVPGVDAFEPIDADTYEGALKVKVGPIGVRLQGRIVVAERNREQLVNRLDIQASERRINSTVSAKATIQLTPISDAETELHVVTEASILGKLGEFGQAVMRRKADQMLEEFVRNMSRAIGAA